MVYMACVYRHHGDTPYLLSSTDRNFVNCTAHVTIRCRYEEGEQLLVLIRDVVLPGGKGPYRESAQDNVRVKVRLAALRTFPRLPSTWLIQYSAG
jgi:hypothetical protein